MMSSNLHLRSLTERAPETAKSHRFRRMGVNRVVWDGVERGTLQHSMCSCGEVDTPAASLTHHKTATVSRPAAMVARWAEIAFTRCNSERDGVYTVSRTRRYRAQVDELALHELGRGPAYLDPGQQSHVSSTSARRWPRAFVLFSFATGREALSGGGISRDFYSDDALSPTGERCIFHQSEAGHNEIYSVPLSGNHRGRLVSEDNVASPDVDARRQIHASIPTGETWVHPWRVSLAGGPIEPEHGLPAWDRSPRTGGGSAYTESQTGEAPAIWRADLSNPAGRYFARESSSITVHGGRCPTLPGRDASGTAIRPFRGNT